MLLLDPVDSVAYRGFHERGISRSSGTRTRRFASHRRPSPPVTAVHCCSSTAAAAHCKPIARIRATCPSHPRTRKHKLPAVLQTNRRLCRVQFSSNYTSQEPENNTSSSQNPVPLQDNSYPNPSPSHLSAPGGRSVVEFISAWDKLSSRLSRQPEQSQQTELILNALKLGLSALQHAPPSKDGRTATARAVDTAAHLADLSVAGLPLDAETIAAGVLADAVEANLLNLKAVERKLGSTVAVLVHHLLRVRSAAQLVDVLDDESSSAVREMCLAFYDVRAVVMEVVARHEALAALGQLPQHEQHLVALQVLQVYAPLGHALGLKSIAADMECTCLQALFPTAYEHTAQQMAELEERSSTLLARCSQQLQAALEAHPSFHTLASHCSLRSRMKSQYSVMKKLLQLGQMASGGKRKSEIFDLLGLRAIVAPRAELPPAEREAAATRACYIVREAAEALWDAVEGRSKDYISNPKPNGYQSLHLTLRLETGGAEGGAGAEAGVAATEERLGSIPCVELQVRTEAMDSKAESGEAAHTYYKGGLSSHQAMQLQAWTQMAQRALMPQPQLPPAGGAAAGRTPSPLRPTPADVATASQMFRHLDLDGDGRVTAEELAACLDDLGAPSTLQDAKALLTWLDLNADNSISFDEFLAFRQLVGNRRTSSTTPLPPTFSPPSPQPPLHNPPSNPPAASAPPASPALPTHFHSEWDLDPDADQDLDRIRRSDPTNTSTSSSPPPARRAGPRSTQQPRPAAISAGSRRFGGLVLMSYADVSTTTTEQDLEQDPGPSPSRQRPSDATGSNTASTASASTPERTRAAPAPQTQRPTRPAPAQDDYELVAMSPPTTPTTSPPKRPAAPFDLPPTPPRPRRVPTDPTPPPLPSDQSAPFAAFLTPFGPSSITDQVRTPLPTLHIPPMGPTIISNSLSTYPSSDALVPFNTPAFDRLSVRLEFVRNMQRDQVELIMQVRSRLSRRRTPADILLNGNVVHKHQTVGLKPGDVVSFGLPELAFRLSSGEPQEYSPVVAALRKYCGIETWPEEWEATEQLDMLLLRMNRSKKLRDVDEKLSALAARHPSYPGVWYTWALLAVRSKRYSAARDMFRAAVQCSTTLQVRSSEKTLQILDAWAKMEWNVGNQASARRLWHRALAGLRGLSSRQQPLHAAPKLLHSWAMLEAGVNNMRNATRLADMALARSPLDPSLHLLAGYLASRAGNNDLACQHFQRAHDLEPRELRLYLHWPTCEGAAGRTERARALFQRGLNFFPTNAALLNVTASFEMEHDNVALARKMLERLLQADPQSPEVLPARITLARLEFQDGQPDRSREHLVEALDMFPDYVPALNSWATLEARLGNHQYAEALARRALLLTDGANDRAQRALAVAFRGQGEEDLAANLDRHWNDRDQLAALMQRGAEASTAYSVFWERQRTKESRDIVRAALVRKIELGWMQPRQQYRLGHLRTALLPGFGMDLPEEAELEGGEGSVGRGGPGMEVQWQGTLADDEEGEEEGEDEDEDGEGVADL